MNAGIGNNAFYEDLDRYFKERLSESRLIPAERKLALECVSAYVTERVNRGASIRLIFICTHNSRRSQMAQIWAQTAALFIGIPEISAYSGGTEVTAFHSGAVSAMARAGFRIERCSAEDNPEYLVHAGAGLPPVRAYSKAYQDPSIPGRDFCAVLTCSRADRGCPVISGADRRVLIPYEDPKVHDGTDLETVRYDESCREISREMGWMFTRANPA